LNADPLDAPATAGQAARDEPDAANAVFRAPALPASWRGQPRCTRCGRWVSSPGGAGFGDGKTFCDPCALHLDFERGDGSAR